MGYVARLQRFCPGIHQGALMDACSAFWFVSGAAARPPLPPSTPAARCSAPSPARWWPRRRDRRYIRRARTMSPTLAAGRSLTTVLRVFARPAGNTPIGVGLLLSWKSQNTHPVLLHIIQKLSSFRRDAGPLSLLRYDQVLFSQKEKIFLITLSLT